MDLDLVLLEDLLKELDSRFEHWVFSGMQTGIGGKDKILTIRKWNGNSVTCHGLAGMLQNAIYSEHMKKNELEKEDGIL
jgi:hypothetical protein